MSFPQKLWRFIFHNLFIQSICNFHKILSFTFLSHRRFFSLQRPHCLHRMSEILNSQLRSPTNQSLAPLMLLRRLLDHRNLRSRINLVFFGLRLLVLIFRFLIKEFTSDHIFASAFSIKIINAIFKMLVLILILIQQNLGKFVGETW